LVVRAENAKGRTLSGKLVHFKITEGSGSVWAGSSITDKQGQAQEYLTLGSTFGPNVVEVRAVNPSSGEKVTYETFAATAALPGTVAFRTYDGKTGIAALWTTTLDGTDPSYVTEYKQLFSPAWAPDGGKLAFHATEGSYVDIFVVNPDGTGLTNVTATASFHEGSPTWAPDGQHIAFWGYPSDGGYDVFRMNADGTGVQRLTTHSARDLAPAWSPDGSKIAFVSERDGDMDVYVMNPDGSGVVQLTNDSFEPISLAWSPDGTQIAFSGNVSPPGLPSDMWVMNADGSGLTQLGLENANNVSWSSDGEWLAFDGTSSDYGREMYFVRPDGTDLIMGFQWADDQTQPVWAP
jgi:tol-pal system beta propeller repeat protein TolB